MSPFCRRLMQLFIVASLLAALLAVGERVGVERANRTVGLVIDYEAWRDLADIADVPVEQVLIAARERGAWAAAVGELTVAQAARTGFLLVLHGGEAKFVLSAIGMGYPKINEKSTYVVWWPQVAPDWMAQSLRLHLFSGARLLSGGKTADVYEFLPPDPKADPQIDQPLNSTNVTNLGLGLSPDIVEAVRQAGLDVVPRFADQPRMTLAQVEFRLAQLDNLGKGPVVFSGYRVPGYPDLVPVWAEGLANREVRAGLIEFAPQPGLDAVVKAADFRGVRVHAVTSGELQIISPAVAVDRWRRAVLERDIRLLYLRPIPATNPHLVATGDLAAGLLAQNLAYIEDVAKAVEQAGYKVGAPQPFRSFSVGLPWLLLMVAGVAAAGLLLLGWVWQSPTLFVWLAMGLALVGFGGLYLKGFTVLARQAPALAAALIFPTLGVLMAGRTPFEGKRPILARYFLAAGVSLAGALLVAALLADVRFMLKLAQFVGVKLAHVGPPVLVVVALVAGAKDRHRGFGRQLRYLLQLKVSVQSVGVAMVIGALGALLLLRTGNVSLPTLPFEAAFRQFLEDALLVRPRTKEIMLGHPVLVVALDQIRQGRVSLGRWLLPIAVIGQLSLVNSFSHIHTPVFVSLWRTILGLIIGLALGYWVARPIVNGLLNRGPRAPRGSV